MCDTILICRITGNNWIFIFYVNYLHFVYFVGEFENTVGWDRSGSIVRGFADNGAEAWLRGGWADAAWSGFLGMEEGFERFGGLLMNRGFGQQTRCRWKLRSGRLLMRRRLVDNHTWWAGMLLSLLMDNLLRWFHNVTLNLNLMVAMNLLIWASVEWLTNNVAHGLSANDLTFWRDVAASKRWVHSSHVSCFDGPWGFNRLVFIIGIGELLRWLLRDFDLWFARLKLGKVKKVNKNYSVGTTAAQITTNHPHSLYLKSPVL